MKLFLARLALFCAPLLLAAGVAEYVLRRQVLLCGVTPFRTPVLPGLSHELRPDFSTLYRGIDVHVNALGFRGADFPARADGMPRLAVVGDSVAFGNAIPLEATLAVQLERELAARGHPAQVLNCGIPGHNGEEVALILEHRVLALRPDLVVYVFVANDIVPTRSPVEIPPDAVIDSFQEFPLRSALLQWLGVRVRGLLRAWGLGSSSGTIASIQKCFAADGKERLQRFLGRMQDLCAERGIPFVAVSYPFLTRPDLNPFADIDAAAGEVCASRGIPCWNLLEAFPPETDLGAYWANPFDPHPSGAANALVAPFLAARLEPLLP